MAPKAKSAAITRSPVVRFGQDIYGIGSLMPVQAYVARVLAYGASEQEHECSWTCPSYEGSLRACAWTAVIAMASTMSLAVQPRERSFAGLSRPCKIGPIAVAPASRSVNL